MEKQISMDKLPVNARGKVITILPESKVRRRLFDMGLVMGTEFKIDGKAPLGDPIHISLRGYNLTLRKNEAKDILVKPI